MRLVGVCPNCGTSFDGEMIARGPSAMSAMLFCECTGSIVGCSLYRSRDGSGLPTVVDLVQVEVDSDAP